MKSSNNPFRPKREAARIAGIYLLFGFFWILLSDRLLLSMASNARQLTSLQSYKGWFFIFGSAVALFGLIARLLQSVKIAQENQRASEARFEKLTEVSPDGVLVEKDGRIVYANTAATILLAGTHSGASIIGRNSLDFVDPQFHQVVLQHRALSSSDRKISPLIDIRVLRSDGTSADIQAACGDVEWQGAHALQMVLRNVTELKRMQEKLRRLSERLQLAVEGAGECIWDFNFADQTVTLSGGLKDICEVPASAVMKAPPDWKAAVHPDDLGRVDTLIRDAMQDKNQAYECEFRMKATDGAWKWLGARGVVVERNDGNRPVVMTGTLADITVRKDSDELAWRYANLDILTGLPNRRLFHEKLESELRQAKRAATELAVLYIDLDGFKKVNDLYGHNAGDLLLLDAGHRLKKCVRESDTVARLGGDEFAITLTHLADVSYAELVCEKILSSLAPVFHVGSEVAYVSASIGVSLYPMDGKDADELTRKADQAMYTAKRGGKNQFHFFTREMDELAHERLRIAYELRRALDEKQLAVQYQPVVELASGRITKAEALLRWKHPTFGNIEPSLFIPIAEETGLIKPIENWVFAQAAVFSRVCAEQAGLPFQISVNKSPLRFISSDRDSDWLKYIQHEGISGNSISIEITEGVLLDANEAVIDGLREYRAAGVQFSLDDFGTGYSSMAYLQKFQIDYVKIDQSFVRDITNNPSSRTIAETIILMAHRLGKKVIAEGIETREQCDCLVAAGCDYGQGFLFSPAVPPETLGAMLREEKDKASMRARQS